MREIKFRFWDKEENDWLVDGQDETSIYDFAFRYGMNWDHIAEPLNRVVVMQYTGLKDKNDKEIYEGDILKIPEFYETPENTAPTYYNEKIMYSNGSFILGEDSPLYEDAEYISAECEVIGNVFEMPDWDF
jgi:uncharacterized phage protein (TIGR01671 family)